MKTAKLLSEKPANRVGAIQRHYQLSEPLTTGDGGTLHVVVSAIPAAFDHGGPETFVFAADESGKITNFMDLEGSFRGDMDHDRALRGAGYEIAP